MYEYFKGIISKITAKYIVLEVNSIGYILHVANPYAYSSLPSVCLGYHCCR